MLNARILRFLGLAYAIDWLLVGGYLLAGGQWNTVPSTILTIVYMLVPAVVAFVLQKYVDERPVKSELGIRFNLNRWWAVAWLIAPVLAMATLGVSLFIPGVSFSPGMEGMFDRFADLLPPEEVAALRDQVAEMPLHPFWISLLQGLVAGITVNAVAGFGEELGWRGYLYKELQALGFWKRSLFTGFVWGLWHAPIILQGHNYPQHPVAGVFMMIGWTILLAPLFDWLRTKSGSVIAVSVLHGTLNATGGLAVLVVTGGTDLLVGMTGLAGFVVIIAVNIALFAFGAGRRAAT